MVWQVVVPGTQMVTVVNNVLTSALVLIGPASTMTPTTFEAAGVAPPTPEPDASSVPPPPPPQDSIGRQSTAQSTKYRAGLTAALPRSRRRVRPAASTPAPKIPACARAQSRRDRLDGSAGDGVPRDWLSPRSRSCRSTAPICGADRAWW